MWKRCGPFFNDLLAHGVNTQPPGGLLDRQGRRHVVFDIDGTRRAYRQRAVVQSTDRPRVRRRVTAALAVPGYQGRKRGEVVRSRLVVQQAHTREWLGTFGDAGNGKRWLGLERACEGVAQYMRGHGLLPDDSLMRMDGEFGWAHAALLLAQGGPGYLMRCSDYRLLETPQVKAALGLAPQRFAQLDTATAREVYEAGWVVWRSEVDGGKTVSTRLVVAATPAPDKGKPKVGKRVGDRVYELFVTSVAPEALTASDVLSLYFGRGGFEQTLSEEDREIEPDRWVSGHPAGQELWQILAQWIWQSAPAPRLARGSVYAAMHALVRGVATLDRAGVVRPGRGDAACGFDRAGVVRHRGGDAACGFDRAGVVRPCGGNAACCGR